MREQIILTAYEDGEKVAQTDITDSPIRYLEVMLKFQEMIGRTVRIKRIPINEPQEAQP